MKRAITLFLTLTASATLLTACNSNDKGIERISLSKDAEIAHKVYNANLPENILNKHKNFATQLTMPDVAPDQYDYQVRGMRYTEWGSGTYILNYLDSRVSYRVDDYGDGTYTQGLGLNINEDKFTYIPFLANTELDLYNTAKETVTDIYVQNGLLHFKTEYKPEGVKAYYSDYYPDEDPTGVRIFSEFVVDAKTYEATEISVVSKKDNVETIRYFATAKYDVKEPTQIAIMSAAFERPSQNKIHLELDVDLNKPSHYKIDVMVPSNTEVTYLCDDNNYVYFDDADYSTLNRWNRMTDLHRYVVRNPSAEQRAKFDELMSALMA